MRLYNQDLNQQLLNMCTGRSYDCIVHTRTGNHNKVGLSTGLSYLKRYRMNSLVGHVSHTVRQSSETNLFLVTTFISRVAYDGRIREKNSALVSLFRTLLSWAIDLPSDPSSSSLTTTAVFGLTSTSED